MEKRDAVLSKPDSSAPAVAQRPPSRFAKYWDFLGVLLLMLASFPTAWLAPRTVTFVPNYGLVDDNWHLDASFKALRGIWVGRDVAFTHGPLYQFLSSIPARSMPLSVGALYATWNTVPIWCAFLFAYLALRLLLPEQPRMEALRPVAAAVLLLGNIVTDNLPGAAVRCVSTRLVCG